jgi:hypothetical protein
MTEVEAKPPCAGVDPRVEALVTEVCKTACKSFQIPGVNSVQ